MRPNSGKKGSRGTKGSKKEAKFFTKRGSKPGRGGSKNGRGGGRAGSGRPLTVETGSKKGKLSGLRKGDLSGKDLRHQPVEFVKAVDDFELTLDTKPGDEDSTAPEQAQPAVLDGEASSGGNDEPTQSSPASGSAADSVAESDTGSAIDSAADSGIGSAIDPTTGSEAGSAIDSAIGSTAGSAIGSAADSTKIDSPGASASASASISEVAEITPVDAQPAPAGNNQQELTDSDFDELDARLEIQFNETDEPSNPRDTQEAPVSEPSPSFDESVSRLALDSSSDSEIDSSFEYDQYNASQVDESLFDSDIDTEFTGATYDDFDYSDLRAGANGSFDALDEDEEDNMEELDDDQIFALASMATRRVSEYEDLDTSGFDKYDEFDEYFDQLLDRSTDAPPATKKKASESRRLKQEARELLHALNFGKAPVLWQKYPEEIGIREVLDEIRHFAAQKEHTSLSFPPLDTNANWYVKQLAREHGLRPSVQGHNSDKHVICYLTSRATPQGGKAVNKLLNRRKFFRRVDKASLGRNRKDPKTPGAKVRDGHVVGQHASEITNENFGHRLMRQMGWSEGSGLGKERAGIVVPISATVKLTKTGLGA